MVELFYAKVSAINYAAGTISIALEEKEGQVITGVPMLAMCYEMPQAGETVAALLNKTDGRIERGVILGKIFSKSNPPGESGQGIFYKQFSDGKSVKYDPNNGSLEVAVKKIVVDEVEYGKATQKG